jgi:hypothetical protein
MGEKATEVKQGFWRAGTWLLGFGWLFLVFSGLAIVTTHSPPPHVVGWALLAAAAGIALLTVDRWAKIFPGLLAYGVLGSVLSLVDGHAVNHPEVPVSRLEGVAMIVFFTVAAVLSFTFTKRKLHVTDRAALFAFVVCFFWQAVAPNFMWVVLGVGFCFLLAAWLYDHFRHRRGHSSRSASHVTAH